MNTEIIRLTASDYDELIALLNSVFSRAHKREEDFEYMFPKMCIRDDEHMGKHIGIKEDGKLVAVAGIYLLPAKIAGKELMFSTVGNIATAPEAEGKGYMSLLVKKAMEEIKKMGADASRLSGSRQRYNRFGYEAAGWTYNYLLYPYNIRYFAPDFESDISFVPVSENDTEMLSEMMKIYNKGSFIVERKNVDDFYLTLKAWGCIPFVAIRKNGEVSGYVSVYPDKKSFTEVVANNPLEVKEVIMQWCKTTDLPIHFKLMPHMKEEIKLMSEFCDEVSLSSPSRFKIISWSKVVDAFLKLKSTYENIEDADFVVEIEGYGNIRIKCENNACECTDTTDTGTVKLTELDAVRYFFDPMDTRFKEERKNIMPLPMSWDSLDRV